MTDSLIWLLPVWIIGAPLAAAIVNLVSTPKSGSSLDRPHADNSTLRRTPV